MADNSQAGLAVGVGDVFATDDVGGGVKIARAKMCWGVDGGFVDTSLTNQLPIQIGSLYYPQSTGNNSTAQLASGATFTGTVETILSLQAAQIEIVCDQPYTLIVEQFIDAGGTQKSSKDSDYTFTRLANIPTNENITLPGNYFRIKVTNNGGVATTTLRIDTTFGMMATAPYALSNLGNAKNSINELNGTAIDTNSGVKSAGTQRMVIATDQPNLTTPLNVALAANQSVNVAQIGGTNTVNGGVAGVQAVGGNVANAVAATANPVPVGGIFTTVPATLTTGQTATMQFTAAQNLKHDISTIAGTAPTTVGKLDVKGADGDVFVRQATAANLNATVVGTKTNNNAAPGALNVGTLGGVATAAAPASTEGNQVAASLNLTGDQRCISKISDGTTTAGVIAGTTALKQDVSSVAGTATVTAAAGVQKVGIVGNANVALDAATSAAVPANALHIGGKAAIANPTNATAGNLTPFMLDKAGRLVTALGHVRELIGNQQTATSLNTEVTIITAGGAGVFLDLASILVTTAVATAGTLTIKDATAGTTRAIINYPNAALAPATPLYIEWTIPLTQAVANNNWTITNSQAVAINVTCTFVKNL